MPKLSESFRDPNGYLFTKDGRLLRQINKGYRENYELLMQSGLYEELASKGWLVRHEECDISLADNGDIVYKVIAPAMIKYISYPYEWCFNEYKDAALLTLYITLAALEHGMILKDASAYNVQFRGAKPTFIDTLSFEKYEEGAVWVAYGQFCRHFLAPLLLMANVDPAMGGLMRNYIDGVPLPLAAKLMPEKLSRNLGIKLHIFTHAKQIEQAKQSSQRASGVGLPKRSLIALLESLKEVVESCVISESKTDWSSYYDNMHNYTDAAFADKARIVDEYLGRCGAKFIADLGGNRGEFSRVAGEREGSFVVCADIDHTAVNNHYNALKAKKIRNILPLTLDLTNPSPAIGWANGERHTMSGRTHFDCVMALALIHHLAIGNNLPLGSVAEYFSGLADYLIIEFVPKGDSRVDMLLANREDIFPDYTGEDFERAFSKYYDIVDKTPVAESLRTVYLMKAKG